MHSGDHEDWSEQDLKSFKSSSKDIKTGGFSKLYK